MRSYVAYPGVGLALSTLVAYNASSGNGFNTLLISKFAIGVFNVPETYLSTRHHPSFRSYATDQYIYLGMDLPVADLNLVPLKH